MDNIPVPGSSQSSILSQKTSSSDTLLVDDILVPRSSQSSVLSQETSSSDTLFWDDTDRFGVDKEYNVAEEIDASTESKLSNSNEPSPTRTECVVHEVALRPPETLIMSLASITGYTMCQVWDPQELTVPANPANVAVAVVQGLDIGYFSSWFEALPHVCVLGALYSLHDTLYDAQLCFMRALLKQRVCFLYGGGILEAAVSAVIPEGFTTEDWWFLFWSVLGKPIPPIDPTSDNIIIPLL